MEQNSDVQNLEQKKQKEIVTKTYALAGQHFKKRPNRKKRKNVRTAELLIMSKKCSKIKFSIVLSWDIWNKTVGNENGLGFCSVKGVLYA